MRPVTLKWCKCTATFVASVLVGLITVVSSMLFEVEPAVTFFISVVIVFSVYQIWLFFSHIRHPVARKRC